VGATSKRYIRKNGFPRLLNRKQHTKGSGQREKTRESHVKAHPKEERTDQTKKALNDLQGKKKSSTGGKQTKRKKIATPSEKVKVDGWGREKKEKGKASGENKKRSGFWPRERGERVIKRGRTKTEGMQVRIGWKGNGEKSKNKEVG